MSGTPPASVAGRYQLYKEGTQRICSWLARTADAATSNSDPKIDHVQTTKRPPNESVFQTKARDLLSLANTIVHSRSLKLVPSSILDLLTEVITARRSCAEFYASQNMSAELAASYRGHLFFVEVLEQVQEILAPSKSQFRRPESSSVAASAVKKAKKEAVSVEMKFSNIFACLEIEEPSSSPLGKRGPSGKHRNKAAAATVDLKLDPKIETSFKIYCFLEDVYEVRSNINKAWEDFRDGSLSFLAASLILETGMALLRVSNAELSKVCPEFTDWSSLPDFFGMQSIMHDKESRDLVYLFPRQDRDKSLDLGSQSAILDRIYPAAAHQLRELRKDVVELHDKAREASGDPREQIIHAIEGSLYHTLCAMALGDDCFAFSDFMKQMVWEFATQTFVPRPERSGSEPEEFFSEFEQGFENFVWIGQLPIWLVAGYQIYCDVFEIIGSKPTLTGDLCLSQLGAMFAKVKEHRSFTRAHDMALPHHPMGLIVFMKNDYEKFCEPDKETKEHCPSNRRLPCRAGSTIFKAKHIFHASGILETKNQFALSAMAHLYSAGRALGLVKSTWVDMDFVLSRQNNIERLITLPKDQHDPNAWARCFLLALGVPVHKVALSDRPTLPSPKTLYGKGRKLEVSSALIRALDRQYHSDEAMAFIRGDMLDVVLKTLAQRETASKKPGNTTDNKTYQFTPQRLLATFRELIVADEPALNFDYLNFTVACVQLGKEITTNIHKSLGYSLDKGVPTLPEAVYMLLTCTKSTTVDPKATDGHGNHTSLHLACEKLDEYLTANGNKFSQEAFQQSSGHIPKSLRPQLKPFDAHAKGYTGIVAEFLEEDYEDLVIRDTPSHTTIYDPKGSEKRLRRAQRKSDGIYNRAMAEVFGKTKAKAKRKAILEDPGAGDDDGWETSSEEEED